MARSIKITKVYDFPISDVWEALVNKTAMSAWLMPCNIEPVIGHKFQFKTKPYPGFNGIIDCEILQLKEQELLSFSWSGGSLENTIVTFKLSKEGAGTKLDFEHRGFEGLLNRIIVKKILSNGWKKKILTVLLPQHLSKWKTSLKQ